jgi:glycosyltransferase involved in cell wall biosynthesis
MKIAQVAPLAESVPPKRYGGTERIVSYLTEELVAMGHEVTLFATGDSCTSAELVSGWPRALRSDPGLRDRNIPYVIMLDEVCRRGGEFDVIHCHLDYRHFFCSVANRFHFLRPCTDAWIRLKWLHFSLRSPTRRWSPSRIINAHLSRKQTSYRRSITGCR